MKVLLAASESESTMLCEALRIAENELTVAFGHERLDVYHLSLDYSVRENATPYGLPIPIPIPIASPKIARFSA